MEKITRLQSRAHTPKELNKSCSDRIELELVCNESLNWSTKSDQRGQGWEIASLLCLDFIFYLSFCFVRTKSMFVLMCESLMLIWNPDLGSYCWCVSQETDFSGTTDRIKVKNHRQQQLRAIAAPRVGARAAAMLKPPQPQAAAAGAREGRGGGGVAGKGGRRGEVTRGIGRDGLKTEEIRKR